MYSEETVMRKVSRYKPLLSYYVVIGPILRHACWFRVST